MIKLLLRIILSYIYGREENETQLYPLITAVVPSYNEDEEILNKCVGSLLGQCDEIIVVDDGSDTPIVNVGMLHNKVKIVRIKHSGKKVAEMEGIKLSTGTFVLGVDSDTIFDKDFVKEVLKKFDYTTGAVVGDIKMIEEKGINRMFSKVYYNAFNLWRASMSVFGQVPVLSGAATMYRKEALMETNEEYMQRDMVIGNDRHRTFLLLKNGWKAKYAERAIAYTEAPRGMKFVKQQLRWNKSFWLGLIYSYPLYLRASNFFFTLDILTNAFSRILNILALVYFFILVKNQNWEWLGVYLGVLAFYGLINSIYGLVRTRKISFLWLTLWAYYSVFLIAPLNLLAILTASRDKWSTR